MNREYTISVCSPAYNEAENLPLLIRRVDHAMRSRYQKWEQVLVDDGSKDLSVSVIEAHKKDYPNISLVRHDRNLGESYAWDTAFKHATGDVVVMLAADLQSPPEEIPKMVDMVINQGVDVASGIRQNRKDRFYYWAATRVLNQFMCWVFGLKTKDVSSSFFAVKKEFLENLHLYKNDHRYILAILKRRGANIKEIPFRHAARHLGESKYSKLKVVYAIPEIIRFTMRFFSGRYDSHTKAISEPKIIGRYDPHTETVSEPKIISRYEPNSKTAPDQGIVE